MYTLGRHKMQILYYEINNSICKLFHPLNVWILRDALIGRQKCQKGQKHVENSLLRFIDIFEKNVTVKTRSLIEK